MNFECSKVCSKRKLQHIRACNIFSVRATEDYKGNGGELNIKKGNIVQYTTQVNEHFSFGCLNDKWGNFPSQIAQVSVTEKGEIKMEFRLGESR